MGDFRIRIDLRGPLGTPLTSGGIFGQFCWSVREAEGERALTGMLQEFDQAPLIFSDAFPADTVPAPLLAPERARCPEAVAEGDTAKKLARRTFMGRQAFLEARDRLDHARLRGAMDTKAPQLIEHRTAHNRIDRLTNTTPLSGGLFFTDEFWPPGDSLKMDFYARGEIAPERLERRLGEMGMHGFGKDASTGRGRFDVLGVESVPGLSEGGSRWVSWSRGCLSEGMTGPRYRIYTHYGKLGGLGREGANPFKYPLTLWKPGATFAGGARGPFGKLLRDVHPQRTEVVHNAMHFAVRYTEAG